ncbi:ferric reductase like transmembrane component [Diplocarpon rosae]|nr:ferric reductase like transmembrane component [Diplocarpon rosae]
MRSILPVILVFFRVLQDVSAAGAHGIIGFGISLYQDECCQACYDSLSALWLSCTIFDEEMSMNPGDMDAMAMGTTSPECYATNVPWLETMAYCIRSNCDAHGFPAAKQAACFSTHAVAGAATPTFQQSLPALAPTVELAPDATWLNATSLVNQETYASTYGTEAEFARSEYIHTRYAVILYLITIGVIVAAGMFAQARAGYPALQRSLAASRLWATCQQSLFLPALFGSRRMEPLPGHLGYLPGRPLGIFIALYVAMNVILCSVSFRSFQPNTFWPSTGAELCEYVGNRTGTLSMVNMSMAILFAGRNNLLIALTGWSQSTFLTLHRWTARVATVQAVVHSIVYTLQYFEPAMGGAKAYAAKAAETFYWVGIMATIAMCLAATHSMLPLRAGWYETFLATHIALVILTLVALWYHLVPHFGYVYGYQVWLYICFAFWASDRLARLARLVWYNRIGESTAMVEAIPGCDVLQVTLFPRTWHFGPGQHSFLYLPDSSLYLPGLGAKFWENHPFSVAGWRRRGEPSGLAFSNSSAADHPEQEKRTEDPDVISVAADAPLLSARERPVLMRGDEIQDCAAIQFLIRVHAGMTASLQRRVLASPAGCAEVAMYTEGPYAGHRATLSPLAHADTILLIVGGVGVTTALGFIQEFIRSRLQTGPLTESRYTSATRLILAWSAREISLIHHVQANFLAQARLAGVELLLWCTGPNDSKAHSLTEGSQGSQTMPSRSMVGVTVGKMNIRSVIRDSVEEGLRTTVLVCGPGNMIDETTREVVSCVRDGIQIELVEEIFGW